MTQNREVGALLSQSFQLAYGDARDKLHAASRRDLDAIRRQRQIVANRRERPYIHHRACRARIQREAQDDASRRAEQLGLRDDETAPSIEGEAHNTTAVPSGISPV